MTDPSTTKFAKPKASTPVSVGVFAHGRYYVCLAILVASAISLFTFSSVFSVYFTKKPVPLKVPLSHFDDTKLAPEYSLHPKLPRPIEEDMLQSLGTREYVNLRIVDTSKASSDPTRVANVMVTYYTGDVNNMVPHVPEECYLAGGYKKVSDGEDVEIEVPGLGINNDKIKVRVLEFEKDGKRSSVIYFFRTNEKYATTRNEVRLVVQNPFSKYSYYAKFEFNFTNNSFSVPADKEAALTSLSPLLAKIMPIFIEDHFADWDTLTHSGDTESKSSHE